MQATSSRRLFVGFGLKKSEIEKTSLIKQRLSPFVNDTAKVVDNSNLHMTLGFLGQIDQTSYASVVDAIELMPKPTFMQELDTLSLWQSAQLICLKGHASEPLLLMAQSLLLIAKNHKVLISEHQYVPHISLFRQVNITTLPTLRCTTRLSLMPTELHLYQSIKNKRQTDYSVLKSWPLTEDNKKAAII
jgi:2'-5' RNA ligase